MPTLSASRFARPLTRALMRGLARLGRVGGLAPLALAASLVPLAAGCGAAVYQPSRSANFELDASKEINDEDVRKAFEARPQLGDRVVVAYYSFDATKAEELDAMLKQVPGVAGTYRIPPLMVTGQKRYDEHRGWEQPKEVSVKKLRLLAARAHADVLVLFDYAHRDGSANGWTALTPLLLPILFVPFLDNSVESYAETYVVDTRNGYLYGHLTVDEQGGEKSATIWGTRQDTYVKEQWASLVGKTRDSLAKLLREEAAKRAPVAALAQPVQPVQAVHAVQPAPAQASPAGAAGPKLP